MRALHTSDWHIGVDHYRVDRRPDHDHVFAQIRNIAIEEKVDFILHTGDFFDAKSPGIDALKYGWGVLEDLSTIAPIVLLAGNHDDGNLFEFIETVRSVTPKGRKPIYLVHAASLRRENHGLINLKTADGERVRIAAVPFIKSRTYVSAILRLGADHAGATYADELARLEKSLGDALHEDSNPITDITMFAAHLLVDNAVVSGSERKLDVTDEFGTRSHGIPVADYLAFGHIHKPQVIPGRENGRYAGSPLPIDFGEKADQKCVYIVSGRPGYPLKIAPINLNVGRPMVDYTGSLQQLIAEKSSFDGAIAKVTLIVEGHEVDPLQRVREILDKTLICHLVDRLAARATPEEAPVDLAAPEPTLDDLFTRYLDTGAPVADPPRVGRYFTEFYHSVQAGTTHDATLRDLEDLS